MFQPRCKHRHTEESHPHCFVDGVPAEITIMNPSKVLVIDVETLPLLGYTFNPWNTSITPSHLVKDFCILSYAAKWLGDDRIISDILTPREAISRNDKRLLQKPWRLLEEADVIITHNGKRFDIRKLNARFWKNKYHKPASYKMIDTLVAAKSVFGLTYNSMDFIAEYVEMDRKLDTNFALWVACDNGDREALRYMREYNEQDIRTQESIYMEMREWIPNHPDMSVYARMDNVCPVCLSTNHERIGFYVAKKLRYNEHRCADCNAVWHDSNAVKE